MYICAPLVCSARGDQKEVPDSLDLDYGCWELNLGSLEEQSELLTMGPPL